MTETKNPTESTLPGFDPSVLGVAPDGAIAAATKAGERAEALVDAWVKAGNDPMYAASFKIWGYETNYGSFAQFTKVQAHQCMPKPKHMTWEEAGSYVLVAATAWRMLHGWPELWLTWAPCMRRLEGRFQLLAPDLRIGLGNLFGRPLVGVAFVDGGNVFQFTSDIDFGRLRGTLGLGGRWDSPVGPLRLDVGRKMSQFVFNNGPESRWEWHFSLGHAF